MSIRIPHLDGPFNPHFVNYVSGTMRSGKTGSVIAVLNKLVYTGRQITFIRPLTDTRTFVSRNGQMEERIQVKAMDVELLSSFEPAPGDIVAIDELHLFGVEAVDTLLRVIYRWHQQEVLVFAISLIIDAEGIIFPIHMYMSAMPFVHPVRFTAMCEEKADHAATRHYSQKGNVGVGDAVYKVYSEKVARNLGQTITLPKMDTDIVLR
jgi:thymidine kinase